MMTLFDQPYTPELTQKDMADFSEATQRVLNLMLCGKYFTATEIIAASGQREGLRRMRSLRKHYNIERVRIGSSRDWSYRLTAKENV